MTPFILESGNTHLITLDVFSRLQKDRIVFLGMQIDNDVANTIIAQLLYLDSQSHEPIQLYLNTPGGSVSAGLAIYDTMNYIKCDVSTICVGMAASMGAFLLSSGAKGKRIALPNSEILIHQPLVGGNGITGQATDVEIAAKNLLKTKEKLNRILAENCGKDYETLVKDTDRDNWMSANEAMEYGLVDKVIEKR